MQTIKAIKKSHTFFFEQSPSYMQGYSKLYYYLHLPQAYLRFMYYTLKG